MIQTTVFEFTDIHKVNIHPWAFECPDLNPLENLQELLNTSTQDNTEQEYPSESNGWIPSSGCHSALQRTGNEPFI